MGRRNSREGSNPARSFFRRIWMFYQEQFDELLRAGLRPVAKARA
jgi:hypothetical protein